MRTDKKIRNEVEQAAPDLSDNIIRAVDWSRIKSENADKQDARISRVKRKRAWFYAVAAACCAAVVCLILPFALRIAAPSADMRAYAVTIEVNPIVRLEADGRDIVTRQYGLNEDGVIFLHKENYVGQKVETATSAIVRKLETHGFLKGNNVKVCVKDKNGKNYAAKQNSVVSAMENHLEELGKGNLAILDEDELDRIEDEFEHKDLGEYEKSLIERYKQTVLRLAEEKETAMLALVEKLSRYADKDDKEFLGDVPELADLAAFCQKYGYELDFEFDETRGKDIYKLCEDLIEDAEDLREAIEEIEEGKDEDDFKDLLEDLFELAEDHLFGDD